MPTFAHFLSTVISDRLIPLISKSLIQHYHVYVRITLDCKVLLPRSPLLHSPSHSPHTAWGGGCCQISQLLWSNSVFFGGGGGGGGGGGRYKEALSLALMVLATLNHRLVLSITWTCTISKLTWLDTENHLNWPVSVWPRTTFSS